MKVLAWGALALAALARLPFCLYFWLPQDPYNNYIAQALDLARRGTYFAPADFSRLPGAPLFYAVCIALVGERPGLWLVLEHAAGIAIVGLLVRWAWRHWGPIAAVFVGYLLALDLQFPFHESFLLSELSVQLYFVAALLTVMSLRRDKRGTRLGLWALSGMLCALVGLTRGEYLILGPVVALALCLPDSAVRGFARLRRVVFFFGGWLLLMGGWVMASWLGSGYAGVNLQGTTVLTDTVMPIIRYDLPAQPLAKRLLREEQQNVAATGLDPRPAAWSRLQREYGYTYRQAGRAFQEIVYEAIRTQPAAYLSLVWRNLKSYWIPIPWVGELTADAIWRRAGIFPAPGRDLFYRVLAVNQYWGWLLLGLACLSPIAWLGAEERLRWDITLLWLIYFGVCLELAFIRPALARFQCTLYFPLTLQGAAAAQYLITKVSGLIESRPRVR